MSCMAGFPPKQHWALSLTSRNVVSPCICFVGYMYPLMNTFLPVERLHVGIEDVLLPLLHHEPFSGNVVHEVKAATTFRHFGLYSRKPRDRRSS